MSIKAVDVNTLKEWIDNGEAIVVDVRERKEHAANSIFGSNNLPLSKVSKKSLPEAKSKKLVIHCNSGGRSSKACKKLLSEDPKLVIYNLEGGISAWKNAGYATESSSNFFLPLNRQVQLTIGFFVLAGSILAYYVNPLFTILTGFFGIGLTFAGATGYCFLAKLLAIMPWNQVPKSSTVCKLR